jgi:hypothetical protein
LWFLVLRLVVLPFSASLFSISLFGGFFLFSCPVESALGKAAAISVQNKNRAENSGSKAGKVLDKTGKLCYNQLTA